VTFLRNQIVWAFAVAAIGMGCSGGDGSGSHADGFATAMPISYAPTLAADPGFEFDDYEQAFFRYVECARDAGWELADPPSLTGRGIYDAQFRRLAGSVSVEVDSLEACRSSEFAVIQLAWEIKNEPSEQDRQMQREFIEDCLISYGHEAAGASAGGWAYYLPPPPDGRSTPQEFAEFLECVELARSEFDLPSYELP